MAGTITTNTVNSFKTQLLVGGHNFFQTNTTMSITTTSGSVLCTGLTSTGNLVVGMAVVTGGAANIAANSIITTVVNATAINIGPAATGTGTIPVTFYGDLFKMALISSVTPGNNFNSTNTSSYNTMGGDEVASGGGYTTGGVALVNVSPAIDLTGGAGSNVAYVTFSTNPTWTSASFTAGGAEIYNFGIGGVANTPNTGRFGNGVGNNAVACFTFGGNQTVASGTFTVTLPTANGSTGLLRVS